MKRLLPLLLALVPSLTALAQRQTVDLPDGWKFIKHDAPVDFSAADKEWQTVSVPHSYNALDGQNGVAVDGGYYRGPTWYLRTLDIPADWKEKRVFIRFEGAFLVADVYLNGEKLGEHRGGFAAFCYELTGKLKFGAANELRVRVNNAQDLNIAPITADFTMQGGIYRPVHLLVTDKACITPLDYAGPGVYASATNVSAQGADVEVETKLDGTEAAEGTPYTVATYIQDAAGQNVIGHDGSAVAKSVKHRFHLKDPHLWNAFKDPYLYTVVSQLRRGEKVIDEIKVPLGLRTLAITPEKGFLLNGEPYPIHGVNRHQEKQDKGWALTNADHDLDFQLIREMGATAVRLAHYQQADYVLNLCDRTGFLLWEEIPVVDQIGRTPEFGENAKQQLTEMIRQNSNHPSIMTWGTFNELYNKPTPPVETLIGELDALARQLDPTRTPGGVSCHVEKPELNRISRWLGLNLYSGWYAHTTADFGKDIDAFWKSAGSDRPIAMTEYGVGANPEQYQEGEMTQPDPFGQWHPENYQTWWHEQTYTAMHRNPEIWGTFIWSMFDFAIDTRDEGSTPGMNDKGMVSHDRKLRKDTFFFYKANWTPEPMVFLTARRAKERDEAKTEVVAYTNLPEGELTLNGKKIGTQKSSEVHVLRWPDVTLQPGRNVVEVTAKGADGKTYSDRCEWTLAADAAPAKP